MGMLENFSLLKRYGFKLIPYALAKSEKEAEQIAEKLGYPVVLKVVSDEIEHKTDFGGVKVGIRNKETLKLAYGEIVESTRKYKINGILVQKMARKGIELIIGGKKDPQFGHMIVLGLGGIYVEIFRDVTARICPINKKDVEEMLLELKSHPILVGVRGKKPINMPSLTTLLIKTSQFMQKENIKEIDLNPVVFDSKGCDIIDVRFSK
ncbi:MAG: acetate--CoA ligase family protein [Candidatus Micrarchaeota archaeon]